MWEIAPQPEAVALRVEHVVADHDAEIAVLPGGRFGDRAADRDLRSGECERVRDAFHRLPRADDRNPGCGSGRFIGDQQRA